MKIKILSDSTCDLPAELVKEHDIAILPLIVMKDGKEFIDGITITPGEIFAHVAAGGSLCSTAARSVGVFQEEFAKYADSYDALIHINIGSNFSSSYQNACLAAEEFDNVRVIDSMNLTIGQGLVVLKACELAKTADDLDSLVAQLQAFASRVETSFLLDRLDYMAKGGRCSMVTALGANLLNLKPCLEIRDGKLSVVKKYRGSYAKCLVNYVKDRLADRDDLDAGILFVEKTQVTQECYRSVMDAVSAHSHFHTVYEGTAGCTISCHCGPGTLGVIFVRK